MQSSMRRMSAADIPLATTPSRGNRLYQYLRNEGMLFRPVVDGPFYDKHRTPRPSHNDLFGGMLRVPDEDTETMVEFFGKLLEALDGKEILGLAENRTRYSRFYLDLDFEGPTSVNVADVRDIVRTFLPVLLQAFPSVAEDDRARVFRSIIAMSPPKATSEGSVKTGVHVIFPNLILDYAHLVVLNIACREAVEVARGPRTAGCNSWVDVFDLSMYRTGLRMLFVDKDAPCPTCRGPPPGSAAAPTPEDATTRVAAAAASTPGRVQSTSELCREFASSGSAAQALRKLKARMALPETSDKAGAATSGGRKGRRAATCAACRNGKVGQKRPYTVRLVMNGLGAEDATATTALQSDRVRALIECSIRAARVYEERPPFVEFPGCPSLPEDVASVTAFVTDAKSTRADVTARALSAPGNELAAKAITREAKHSGKFRNKIILSPDDKRLLVLRTLVRSYDRRFEGLAVRNAFMTDDRAVYLVNVTGPGDRACLNRMNGMHKSARVFFIITQDHIYQRCTSRSERLTHRCEGVCSRFKGPRVPLTAAQRAVLFDGVVVTRVDAICLTMGTVHHVRGAAPVEDEDSGVPTLEPLRELTPAVSPMESSGEAAVPLDFASRAAPDAQDVLPPAPSAGNKRSRARRAPTGAGPVVPNFHDLGAALR